MKRPLLLVEALASRNDSGLGAMVRLFVAGLRGLADKADIKVILPRSGGFSPGGHCLPILVDAKPVRLWAQVAFPLLIRRLKPDAVFCLGQNLPLIRPASRYAVAVPDAGPLEDLDRPASSHDAYNRRWLRAMAPRAELIVTISEFTKGRLIHHLGLPEGRIRVVKPIGRAGNAQAAGQGQPGGGRFPEGEYFLALGNVEPRKNFPGLIAAYAALKERRLEVPPLYIAGHRAWGQDEAEAAVARYRLGDSVRFTGYLSDADRSAYLSHCTVFVSSSLYEGWGLPLFEALEHGKPAIYHAGSSQEEFARGFAMAVDCRNPGELAHALESLWSDSRERERYGAALRAGFGRVREYDLAGALREALAPLLGLGGEV